MTTKYRINLLIYVICLCINYILIAFTANQFDEVIGTIYAIWILATFLKLDDEPNYVLFYRVLNIPIFYIVIAKLCVIYLLLIPLVLLYSYHYSINIFVVNYAIYLYLYLLFQEMKSNITSIPKLFLLNSLFFILVILLLIIFNDINLHIVFVSIILIVGLIEYKLIRSGKYNRVSWCCKELWEK